MFLNLFSMTKLSNCTQVLSKDEMKEVYGGSWFGDAWTWIKDHVKITVFTPDRDPDRPY